MANFSMSYDFSLCNGSSLLFYARWYWWFIFDHHFCIYTHNVTNRKNGDMDISMKKRSKKKVNVMLWILISRLSLKDG